jgi:hypothetical protein
MPEKTRHVMVTAGGERNAARYRLAVQSQEI